MAKCLCVQGGCDGNLMSQENPHKLLIINTSTNCICTKFRCTCRCVCARMHVRKLLHNQITSKPKSIKVHSHTNHIKSYHIHVEWQQITVNKWSALFLYATESTLRSSIESSGPVATTCFMWSMTSSVESSGMKDEQQTIPLNNWKKNT